MWKRRNKRQIFVSLVLVFIFMISGILGNIGNKAEQDVYAAGTKYIAGYNIDNISAEYTTVEGKKISSKSDGVSTVLIFARTNGNCVDSNWVMRTVCYSKWATDERVRILIIDIDREPVETVRARKEALEGGGLVQFCYDETYEAQANMWSYIGNTIGQSGSVALPVTVLIDKNNKVQDCLTGPISEYVFSMFMEELLETEEDSEAGKTQKILPYIYKTAEGYASQNASWHNYDNADRWAYQTLSYLNAQGSSSYQRLEAEESKGLVHVETYSADFNRTSEKTIEMELPLFGGYFLGKTHNFIVYGQNNEAESTECEVLRVVKYSKTWEREGAVSVKGANTQYPFSGGSLSMTEVNGKLYIHTCHTIFKLSDGINHQANMSYEVDEAAMSVTQSFYGVMNIKYGYVSHSFNQFIMTDGANLYRLDHGDGYPRSLVITKCAPSNITSCQSKEILPITGEIGANDTGVMAGGFALAGNQVITVGNSVDQTAANWSAFGKRNIFVISTDTGLSSTKTTWLTNYKTGSSISVGNPHLVKASEERLYILWEEYDSSTGETMVKIAAIDAQGNQVSETAALYARLSDCAPVYTADGSIAWYATGVSGWGTTYPVFYKIAVDELKNYPDDGRISLAAAEISEPSDAVYMGWEIEPDVTVTYKGQTLEPGTDYTLSYTDNVKVGTATVTITGQGKYRDSITKKFKITIDMADAFSVTREYSSLPNQVFREEEFAFRVDFKDEGALSEDTQITIPAGSEWAGKKLYYYEIMEDGTYQYTSRSTVTKAGDYKVKRNDGSSYVAVTKVPENLGDANGDGKITSEDALAVLKYDVKIEQEKFVESLADCDGEDGISSSDALEILKYDVKLISEFK